VSDDPAPGADPAGWPWAKPLLAGSLAVILACLASLAVLWYLDREREDDLGSERERVMSTATQFVLQVNTFGPEDLDEQDRLSGYVDRVGELMTSKFTEDFKEAQELPEQLVTQADIGRSATVNAVAVSTIGEDSATAIAAFELTHSFPSAKKPKQRIDDRPVPTRWQLNLRKVEGEWLIDDYEVLPETLEDEASPGTPSEQPSLPSAPQSPNGEQPPSGTGGGDR
jgi:Mce-associated membrane protein